MKGGIKMEEQIQEKQAFYKNKKLIVASVSFLLLASIVTAAVLYNVVAVDVTVSEALSTTDLVVSITSKPGETQETTIVVANTASVPLNTMISFFESTNPNNVTYTTDLRSKVVTLNPGNNDVVLSFTIAPDSEIGVLTGDVTLTRVA